MTLRGWADLFAWQLDRASRTPLTRQIYMQVRSAVLSGALRPGARMPSSRAMASKLGVARASVVSAYEHLLAEGYVESRHGSGTFIADDLTGLVSGRHGARGRPRSAAPSRCEPGQMARDERAGAPAALDIAFGQQLLIGRNHGRPRDAEF